MTPEERIQRLEEGLKAIGELMAVHNLILKTLITDMAICKRSIEVLQKKHPLKDAATALIKAQNN